MATTWGRAASLGRATMQPYFDPLDWGPMRDQTLTAAPTFPPFKFEPRRARIDWRMLHGVDVNYIVSRWMNSASGSAGRDD